jgi:Ca2+-transporting ATPase
MIWVFAGTITCLILVLWVPALRDLFSFAPVPFVDLVVCAIAGGLSVVWFECYKYWTARKAEPG